MKYILGLIFLLLSCNIFAMPDEDQVLSVMNQSASEWNRGDIKAFLNNYNRSENTIYVSTSIIKGFENIKNRYLEKYSDQKKMGKLSVKIHEVKKLAYNYILVIGNWHLVREQLPDADGVFTLLFEKIGNDWKIIVDHTS